MLETLLVFLRLGCVSFGGPVAHLGYFRTEFVERRRWLTEAQFAQCVSITQLLPGPGSSQTGMLIGWMRAGLPGALAAWVGFTLPSAALMTLFALRAPLGFAHAGWLHALLLVAVAVVASAILTMRRTLAPEVPRAVIALAVLAAILLVHSPYAAPIAIALAALGGLLVLRAPARHAEHGLHIAVSPAAARVSAFAFVALLVALPVLASMTHLHALELTAKLFGVGSLVFGGGHVVLPLLQSQVVGAGIAPADRVIAGYAAAQAIPGPLFTLSSYVGAIAYNGSLGVTGALLATIGIFAPSFFLIAAVAPHYDALASNARFRSALAGANAGVVGLLTAAFVTPIWTTAIHTVVDAVFAAVAFALLMLLKTPPWIVAIVSAAAGVVLFR